MAEPTPPRVATGLLARCLPRGEVGDAILGDLHEGFLERAYPAGVGGRRPRVAAVLWYWSQVPRLGGRYLLRRVLFRRLYRQLGRPVRHSSRERTGGFTMDGIGRDIRYTLRTFGRNPGFAAATIMVLGIGIGAISLMFSTYNAVVLQPLPFPDPDRLMWIWETTPNGSRNSISYDDYVDFRDGTDAFQSVGAVGVFVRRRLLTGTGDAQQVSGYDISADLLSTLGITPALGRSFVAEDELRGQADVVILSHGLWVRRYGSDAGIIGQTIQMDGRPVVVVGVMPARFDFPQGTEVWSPLQRSAGYASGRGNNNFYGIGRLRAGMTLAAAQTRLAVVAAHIAETYPDSKAGWSVELQSLHDRFFGTAGTTILLLMGIIALVPLVACANVASLFLARAITRKTEFASRLALGAGRTRLIRQLVTESLVVALGGGVLGLSLAYGGGQALRRLAPAALPRLDTIGVDGNVMVFTLLATLLTVPLFGIIPALRSADLDIAGTLKSGGGRGASEHRLRGRSALVIAQVALSLMLILASGLLLRGYLHLQSENPGFQTRNVLYSRVTLPSFKYQTPQEVELIWKELFDHLHAIPGVLAVGAADRPPISGRGPYNEVWASQRPPTSAADKEGATRRFVSNGFFDAAGIPIRAGHVFGQEEEQAGVSVTVINETLARQFFPGEDPVGQTLVLDWGQGVNLNIIGVVADIREQGPGTAPLSTFYLPAWLAAPEDMYVLGRTTGASLNLAGAWRKAIHEVEPDIPDAPIETMADRVSTTLFQPRFRSALVAVFALVSLVLSIIGLYGVLAYFVRQHGHEFGIRLALGATGGHIARLVLTRGMLLVAWGIGIGLGGGLAGARLIQTRGWLPGVDLFDPLTYAAVGLCLLLVAFAACAVPARRALRLHPQEVMRVE